MSNEKDKVIEWLASELAFYAYNLNGKQLKSKDYWIARAEEEVSKMSKKRSDEDA